MKTRILITSVISLLAINSFSQEKSRKCNCFDKEEYKAFVLKEQNQTVVEGNDALITVILNKVQKDDITVSYKIVPGTATINDDIIVPAINTFTIPAGKRKATVHIPTVKDNFSELDESFTIEILEGINSKTNKKLNNNNLIRTRTIVDGSSKINSLRIYTDNGIFKTKPTAKIIEVRNVNGILIQNKDIKRGTYFINAVLENQTISKTIIVTE